MAYKNDITDSLEQLLENLIRMTGHTNQTVDSLQKRVSQLEQQQLGRKQFFLAKTPEK